MRGVPLIVFLYWLYYAAASRGWFALSEFRAGVLALGLTGSGYMAENYRGALQSVDPGQREAAQAVGLGPGTAFRSVVAPQAARIVLPPAINLLIALLKGATIVSVIGLADMFYVARTVSFETFSPFELYTAAADPDHRRHPRHGDVHVARRALPRPQRAVTDVFADISFGPVWDQRSLLLGGIWLMLRVAVASMLIAVAGGLALARLRLSKLRWVSVLAFVLIQVLRGVALYVLVLWLFNGLAVASGITLTAVQTGIIALSLLNSAYLAEVFRAGFEAIPAGQGEAAQAIGLSDGQAARFVLVPQMVRITFPSMGNVFVDIVKDTAILSVIGVSELMRETQRWAQFYFRSFEFYTAAGLIYLAIVVAVSAAWRAVERRHPRPPRR